ncbi:hypothetical protein OG895_02650 [Streptomyces sp. NBC_00201]|uniref:oxidoreductase n=1 Tax=unclassified Streptomyces TaxID=2593676 RepID=UPI00224EB215|nr:MULTISPECIES: hypothetical protein [unclassified Streptomyces]MCX5244154.1 hypothetical protein [Streptomyces sp. NBC_00201]MCX5290113.1 hypothetical protein [Streptomyces sp. NBC_00183]
MALIITEGTQPSEDGQGYPLTPGIHTDAHIAGWRKVTDAVHADGGRIVVQLMHAGVGCCPGGRYGRVEIHGGNGYLVHQSLSSNANKRTDQYGSSVAQRIRFAIEATSAVAAEIGADRTGLRISTGNPYNDITKTDTHDVHPALLDAIDPLGLAYLPRRAEP